MNAFSVPMVDMMCVCDTILGYDSSKVEEQVVQEYVKCLAIGNIVELVKTQNGFLVRLCNKNPNTKYQSMCMELETAPTNVIYEKKLHAANYTFTVFYKKRRAAVNQEKPESPEEKLRLCTLALAEAQAKILAMADELSSVQGELSIANDNNDSLQTYSEALEARANEIQENVDELQTLHDADETRNLELQGQAEALQGQAEAFQGQAEAYQGQIEAYQSQVAAYQDQVETHQQNAMFGIVFQQANYLATVNNTYVISSVWNPAGRTWEFRFANNYLVILGLTIPQPMFQHQLPTYYYVAPVVNENGIYYG
jgi:hypothetical protein